MEQYRALLKKKMIYVAVMDVLLLIAGGVILWLSTNVFTSEWTFGDFHLTDFIHGMQTGILFAFIVIGVVSILRMRTLLKDDTKLREDYIKVNDERTLLIRSKSMSSAMTISLFLLVFAMLIAGLFNPVVCLTLLGVVYLLIIVMLVSKLYYNKKY